MKPKPNQPLAALHRFSFEAIGTAWTVDIYEPVAEPVALQQVVMERIAAYDANYSRFRDDSLVAEMASRPGTYTLPDDAQPLFDIYQALYNLTDGAMTPLIGQTLADAGYDAQYSLRPKKLTAPPAWGEVLTYHFPTLTLKTSALLDVGAAGKGHIVDIVATLLAQHNVRAYCVDAGGDISYHNPAYQPMAVGLEHPGKPGEVVGVAHIHDQSMCGSAGNRRAWGEFHHIINPHTLASPRHLRALWVVADTTLVADALATALFFVPAKTLATRYTFEYAAIHDDYSLERSAAFPAEFFIAN